MIRENIHTLRKQGNTEPKTAGIYPQSPREFAQGRGHLEKPRRGDRNGVEATGAHVRALRKKLSPFPMGVGINTQTRHTQIIQFRSQIPIIVCNDISHSQSHETISHQATEREQKLLAKLAR